MNIKQRLSDLYIQFGAFYGLLTLAMFSSVAQLGLTTAGVFNNGGPIRFAPVITWVDHDRNTDEHQEFAVVSVLK